MTGGHEVLKTYMNELINAKLTVSPVIGALMYGRVMVKFAASTAIGSAAWGITEIRIVALAAALMISSGGSDLETQEKDFTDADTEHEYSSELANHQAEMAAIAKVLSGKGGNNSQLQERAISLVIALYLEIATKVQATTKRPGEEQACAGPGLMLLRMCVKSHILVGGTGDLRSPRKAAVRSGRRRTCVPAHVTSHTHDPFRCGRRRTLARRFWMCRLSGPHVTS